MAERALQLTDTVQQVKDQLGTEVDGEAVLMNIDTGKYYGLDGIGTDIWKRLEAPVTIADLCADLTEAYEGDSVEIEQDVLFLLARLQEAELITVSPAG